MGLEDIAKKVGSPKKLVVKQTVEELDEKQTEKQKEEAKKQKKIREALANVDNLKSFIDDNYPDDYQLIVKDSEVKEYFEQVFADGIVALDTETTGLTYLVDNVVGISMLSTNTRPCYIPIGHKEGDNASFILVADYMRELTERSIDGRLKVIFHNAKFDCSRVRATFNFDKYIIPFFDTLIGGKLLDENDKEHGLKYLFLKYVQRVSNPRSMKKLFKFSDLFDDLGYDVFNPKDVYYYAAFDAVMTLKLYTFQASYLVDVPESKPSLHLVSKHMFDVEMPAIVPVASMEDNGILVSKEKNKLAIDETMETISAIEEELTSIVKNHEGTKQIKSKKRDLIYYDINRTYKQELKKKKEGKKNTSQRHKRALDMLDLFLEFGFDRMLEIRKAITSTVRVMKQEMDWKQTFKDKLGDDYKEARIFLQDIMEHDDKAYVKLKDKVKDWTELLDRMENGEVNWGSLKELGLVIFDIFGLNNGRKDKPRSTDRETLENMQEHNPEYYRFFELVLDHRKKSKLLSSFLVPLDDFINPIDGRVHTNFNQLGTVTTRFSSNKPNLQQLPKKGAVRQQFVASPGYVILGSDFSQQEPRILAHVSGDDKLKESYAQGRDLYATIGELVYSRPYEECLDEKNCEALGIPYTEGGGERRSAMKIVVLGIMYGLSDKSIAGSLGISLDEAQDLMKSLYTRMPKIAQFKSETEQHVKDYGYVHMLWGSKRRLPDANLPQTEIVGDVDDHTARHMYRTYRNTYGREAREALNDEFKDKYNAYVRSNYSLINRALRQGVNSIIQGSGAAMVKRALIKIYYDEYLNELGARLLTTVHDEILIEAPIENAWEAGKRFSQLMIEAGAEKVSVPMKCDVEIMEYWNGPDLYKQFEKEYGGKDGS